MRSEEAGLLEQIRLSPYDDRPRLVLADALTARGDPAGELITIECRTAPLLERFSAWHPEVAPLLARERTLLDRVARESPGLRRLGVSVVFQRGFPFELTMDTTLLATHGEEAFDLAPTAVGLAINPYGSPILPRLPQIATLARVRELSLRSCNLQPAQLVEVLASPHLKDLRSLDLRYDECDRTVLEAIAAAPWASSLETLALSAPAAAPLGLDSLATLPALRALEVGAFDPATLEALGRAACAKTLRRLALGVPAARTEPYSLQEPALAKLADVLPRLPSLTSLTLVGVELDQGEGLAALARAGGGLERLDLSDGISGDRACVVLAREARAMAKLQELGLFRARVTVGGVKSLARADFPALRFLQLSANRHTAGWRVLQTRYRELAPGLYVR